MDLTLTDLFTIDLFTCEDSKKQIEFLGHLQGLINERMEILMNDYCELNENCTCSGAMIVVNQVFGEAIQTLRDFNQAAG